MLSKIILVGVILVGIWVRFYHLDSLPPSLNWDEISHGYNAYSILKTGYDEWGQFLPLANFRAYGDYPLPLNLYLTIPWIFLFGLNALSIRITSALFGVLIVLMIYLLAKEFTDDNKSLLLVTLLSAISPWTILTNRQVLQSTPAVFFIALGVYLFLKGIKKRTWLLVLSSLSFGLSAYAYHNTRIISPFIFIALLWFYRKPLLAIKKIAVITLVVVAIFFVPLIPILLSSQGSARANWVSILDQGAINKLDELRGKSNLPGPLTRLVYNRLSYFSFISIQNYLGYFNPIYLGFVGGSQYQFSVPNWGILYPIQLPFFYIGLLILILKFKSRDVKNKFLLVWLLLSPIPAAITRDPYQVVRSTTMIPPIFVISALGLSYFLSLFNRLKVKIWILAGLILVSLIFFAQYWYFFSVNYSTQYSFAWQYGYKQAIQYVANHQSEYQTVTFTKKYGEPHEFLLFYTHYDPNSYRNDPKLVRYFQSDWYWVDGFSKYLFINDWEVQTKLKNVNDALLVTSPGNYPTQAKLLTTIYFLDNSPAFDIVKL